MRGKHGSGYPLAVDKGPMAAEIDYLIASGGRLAQLGMVRGDSEVISKDQVIVGGAADSQGLSRQPQALRGAAVHARQQFGSRRGHNVCPCVVSLRSQPGLIEIGRA